MIVDPYFRIAFTISKKKNKKKYYRIAFLIINQDKSLFLFMGLLCIYLFINTVSNCRGFTESLTWRAEARFWSRIHQLCVLLSLGQSRRLHVMIGARHRSAACRSPGETGPQVSRQTRSFSHPSSSDLSLKVFLQPPSTDLSVHATTSWPA